ncbi:MAG: hypothetical protein EOM20_17560 [Spartobacteria bacterium]|nr:hypothetical protein [Spartobacteria bacterium]
MKKKKVGRHMKTAYKSPPGTGQDGFILVTSMIVLALLAFLGTTLYTISKPEAQSAMYHAKEREAFYQAEAGVRYVMSQINHDIGNGNMALTADVVNVTYTAPDGYDFEPINAIIRIADGKSSYFVVTGASDNARCVIEATVERPRLMAATGIFGNESVRMQPNGEVYSYSSAELANPTPADSTGQANIGSNVDVTMQNHNVVDGVIMLGEDPSGSPPPPPGGYDSVEVGYINPDPLGAIDGALADGFAYYSIAANNDNATASFIKNNKISTKAKEVADLYPGVYYLTDINLAAKSVLNVLGTPDDPVVIYLHGALTIQPNSDINVSAGLPSNFFIFCDTTDEMRIQPNNDFAAFLYAPYGSIRLQPNNDLKGVFWANDVRCQPNNDIYLDTSLLDNFMAARVKLVQWRIVTD